MGGTNNQTPEQRLNNLVRAASTWNNESQFKTGTKTTIIQLRAMLQPLGIEEQNNLKKFNDTTQVQLSQQCKLVTADKPALEKYGGINWYYDIVLKILTNTTTQLKLPKGLTRNKLKQKIEELREATAAAYEKFVPKEAIASQESKEENRPAKEVPEGNVTKRPLSPIPSRDGNAEKTPPTPPPRRGKTATKLGDIKEVEKSEVTQNQKQEENLITVAQERTGVQKLIDLVKGINDNVKNTKEPQGLHGLLKPSADDLLVAFVDRATLKIVSRELDKDLFDMCCEHKLTEKNTFAENMDSFVRYLDLLISLLKAHIGSDPEIPLLVAEIESLREYVKSKSTKEDDALTERLPLMSEKIRKLRTPDENWKNDQSGYDEAVKVYGTLKESFNDDVFKNYVGSHIVGLLEGILKRDLPARGCLKVWQKVRINCEELLNVLDQKSSSVKGLTELLDSLTDFREYCVQRCIYAKTGDIKKATESKQSLVEKLVDIVYDISYNVGEADEGLYLHAVLEHSYKRLKYHFCSDDKKLHRLDSRLYSQVNREDSRLENCGLGDVPSKEIIGLLTSFVTTSITEMSKYDDLLNCGGETNLLVEALRDLLVELQKKYDEETQRERENWKKRIASFA